MIEKIKYSVCAFLSLLLTALFANIAYSKSLEMSFIGNEAFRITDGDYILLTDFPYKSGVYDYMAYEFYFPGTTGNVLSLITHRHIDHFEPLLFSDQKWNIIGPRDVTIPLEQTKVIKFADNMSFGPIRITPRKSSHANTEHYSYLVNWAGKKLYFTGDTEDISSLKDLPELDALFITGWFYRKAKLNDMLPETEKIIIYHHRAEDIIPDCTDCIIPEQNQIIIIQ